MTHSPTADAPIDRENRDRLAKAMEEFLAHRMTKLDLDELVEDMPWEIEDPTLEHVSAAIVGNYSHFGQDRFSDYLLKKDRDYFYRLILLLRSDGQVEFTRRLSWDFWQVLAFLATTAWFLSFASFSSLFHAQLALIPLGVLVGVILWARAQRLSNWQGDRGVMRPFSSFGEILQARRSVTDFEKRRHAPRMTAEQAFHSIFSHCSLVVLAGSVVAVSPILLVWLAFPYRQTKTRVVFPN